MAAIAAPLHPCRSHDLAPANCLPAHRQRMHNTTMRSYFLCGFKSFSIWPDPPLRFPLPNHPLLEVSVLVYFCPLTSLLSRVTIAPRRSGLCGGSNRWAPFLFIYSSSVLCAPFRCPLPNATCACPCFCVSRSRSSYAIARPQRTLSLVPVLHPLSTRHSTDPIIHAACQLHHHLTQGVSLHKRKRPPS